MTDHHPLEDSVAPNLPVADDQTLLRRNALARWENEGGSNALPPSDPSPSIPELGASEIVQLRMRVIALENLVIAILAEGSDQQRQVASDMASYISPRRGTAQHPLTIRAAQHMTEIVGRAEHFRGIDSE